MTPCISSTFLLKQLLSIKILGAASGTFFGAVQLAWFPDPIAFDKRFAAKSDPRGVARALIRPSFWMSAAGLAFAAVECYAESARGKADSWNSMLGGMAAGAVVGSITKRIDIVTSTSLAMGVFLFAVDYDGPLGGLDENAEARKERMYGVLPSKHRESENLSSLKEKYPQFKDL